MVCFGLFIIIGRKQLKRLEAKVVSNRKTAERVIQKPPTGA